MFIMFFIVLWLTVWYTRGLKYHHEDMLHPLFKAAATASLVTWLVWLFIYNFG